MRILKDISYFSSTCDRPATRGQAARSSSNQLRLCTDHETMVSVSRHVCCRASVSEIQGRTEKRSRALSRKNGSDGQRRSGQNCSSKVQRPRLQCSEESRARRLSTPNQEHFLHLSSHSSWHRVCYNGARRTSRNVLKVLQTVHLSGSGSAW